MRKSDILFSILSNLFMKMMLYFLALSLCLGCLGNSITSANGEEQKPMQLAEAPQRIVVFPLFAEEMLFEMIGPDRIIYVGHKYHENGEGYLPTMALTKDIPGNDWQNSGHEQILDLKPDLVVLLEEFPDLEGENIAFLYLDTPETIDDIMNTLLILGDAVGAPEKAAQMVQDMEAALAQITDIVSSIPEEKRIRASYYEWEPCFEDGELYFYRSNNFSLIASAAGVINASGNDADYMVITRERLVEWNPDLLTVSPVDYDTDGSIWDIGDDFVAESIASFLDDPSLSSVTAIKNLNVHPLRLSESQFIIQSIMDLAQLAYPDLF